MSTTRITFDKSTYSSYSKIRYAHGYPPYECVCYKELTASPYSSATFHVDVDPNNTKVIKCPVCSNGIDLCGSPENMLNYYKYNKTCSDKCSPNGTKPTMDELTNFFEDIDARLESCGSYVEIENDCDPYIGTETTNLNEKGLDSALELLRIQSNITLMMIKLK
jgi:hypothetical protein